MDSNLTTEQALNQILLETQDLEMVALSILCALAFISSLLFWRMIRDIMEKRDF